MKRFFSLLLLVLSVSMANAQTLHSLLFCNMKESGRELDRTAEMNNMKSFCSEIASALGYNHDLRTHSDGEFRSTVFEQELASINVKEGDIVLFYYAGHGCNWDDDDWPHMCFLDRQYWESTAYTKLKEASGNAKLTLCIASCCNMDSEGRKRLQNGEYAPIDRARAKQLFTGFAGKRSIKVSSSIRGQYTWSWSSGNNPGSIFSISMREIIRDALSPSSSSPLTWESVLDATKDRTMAYTKNKQLPQYVIEDRTPGSVAPRLPQQTQTSTAAKAEAKVHKIWIEHNTVINGTKYMAIHVKFETHNMAEKGGRLVAFIESPKGTGHKDKNGKYCTADGNVAVGMDFGSHYIHSTYSDRMLLIPNAEIHPKSGKNKYYVTVGVYDYVSKKYITFSDYATFFM